MEEWLVRLEGTADDFISHVDDKNLLHLVRWVRTPHGDRTPFETVAAYFLPSGVKVVDCGTWWTDEEIVTWAATTTTRRSKRDGKRTSLEPSVDTPARKRPRKERSTSKTVTPAAPRPRARRTPKQVENRPPNPYIEFDLDNASYEQAQSLLEYSEQFKNFVGSAFNVRGNAC